MAIWGMGVMLGPIMGPTLGGWLTEYYTWRWVFLINLPFGIATVLGLMAYMPDTKPREMRFDWLGFATLSLAIGFLQLMLDRGESLGWFESNEIIIEGADRRRRRAISSSPIRLTAEKPFVPPALFRDWNFTLGVFFMFIVGILILASVALITPFVQNVMGYPVLSAGFLLGTRGIGTMASMMVVGRLLSFVDARILIALGMALLDLLAVGDDGHLARHLGLHHHLDQRAAGHRPRPRLRAAQHGRPSPRCRRSSAPRRPRCGR